MGYLDDGETPNTVVAFFDYKPAPIIFEVRGLPRSAAEVQGEKGVMDTYRGIRVGEVIQCEGGYVAGSFAYDNQGKKIREFERDGGGKHHLNFLKAIRSRKSADLNADIETGHLSSALPHMANISFRLGQISDGKTILQSLENNAILVDAFERFQEHLLLNEISLSKTPRFLGPWLNMDSQTEKFTGELGEKANAFLRRDYRPPFVVPEKV
jgi:hypothetical protein